MYLIANCLLTISLEFNISLWFFFFRVKIDKNWSEQILLDGFWQITCLTQMTFKISSGISKLTSKSWFCKQSFIVTQPYSFIYSGKIENLRQSAKPRMFALYRKSLLTPDIEHFYHPRKFPHDPSLSILTPHVIVILILFTLN